MLSSSSSSVAACGARSLTYLLLAAVRLPMLLCCDAMLWAVTFLTFPLRLLAAADRERKLDRLVGEMQGQMERVVWENRDLEHRLRAALRENAALEGILDEMDEEHDLAFARINSLDTQLKALKKDNMRLKEQRAKSMSDTVAAAGKKKAGEEPVAWEEAPAGKDQEEDEEYAAAQKDQAVVYRSGDLTASEEQARQLRATAKRRSLFSVGMSLAVGGIAWSADAPCLPLLAGLVAVVTMSMCSVSRLLRAPADRGVPPPASATSEGAVALLSLNWFLLGVLTYPMLPGVARAVLPRAASLAGPFIAWLAAAGAV